jgi:hypothetical protein
MPPSFLPLRAARRLGLGCLALALLLPAVGCKTTKKSVEMAEVSGKVLYKGQALPGGRITFVSKDGSGFVGSSIIDEQGNYKTSVPVGEVAVSVDNQMLQSSAGAGRKGAGPPSIKPSTKRPGSEEAHAQKGRYVNIPEKYYAADSSGLVYTIKPGSQTIDIRLE